MSAKAKQMITTTVTKTRVKKTDSSNSAEIFPCPICGGVGMVQKGYNKKKK